MDTIKKQKKNTKQEFDERVQIVVKEFAEQVCLSSFIIWASVVKRRTVQSSKCIWQVVHDEREVTSKTVTGQATPVASFVFQALPN